MKNNKTTDYLCESGQTFWGEDLRWKQLHVKDMHVENPQWETKPRGRNKRASKERKNKKDEVTLRCSTNYYSTTITCSSHSFIDGGRETNCKEDERRQRHKGKQVNEWEIHSTEWKRKQGWWEDAFTNHMTHSLQTTDKAVNHWQQQTVHNGAVLTKRWCSLKQKDCHGRNTSFCPFVSNILSSSIVGWGSKNDCQKFIRWPSLSKLAITSFAPSHLPPHKFVTAICKLLSSV